jgi:hypothetical protein
MMKKIPGVEHGNDLSFSVGGIGSKTLTGSKDGKGIVVEFQQSDGTIQTGSSQFRVGRPGGVSIRV